MVISLKVTTDTTHELANNNAPSSLLGAHKNKRLHPPATTEKDKKSHP